MDVYRSGMLQKEVHMLQNLTSLPILTIHTQFIPKCCYLQVLDFQLMFSFHLVFVSVFLSDLFLIPLFFFLLRMAICSISYLSRPVISRLIRGGDSPINWGDGAG